MRRWRTWLLVALLVWIAAVTWWALRPVSDSVPTGTVNDKQTTQTVQCDSPLSGNTKPTEPLPVLQDDGREYKRAPCESVVENARTIYWVNVAIVLIALVVLAKTWKPSAAKSQSLEDAAV